MARSKKEDAAWESYRDELRAMFLDQRLTVEQIQQRMSQQYKFSKRYAIHLRLDKNTYTRLTPFSAKGNTFDNSKSGTSKSISPTMIGALLDIVARNENAKGKILAL